MTTDPLVDPYLESLRGALPTSTDEARIARKLSAAGLALSLSATTHIAAASSAVTTGLAKSSLLSHIAARLLKLPLLAQAGLVTATTTLLATGPVLVVLNHYDNMSRNEQSRVTAAVVPRQTVGTTTTGALPERSPEPPLANKVAPETLGYVQEQPPSPTPRKQRVQSDVVPPQHRDLQESSLAEETRLMDASLGAIRQGRLELAQQLLRSHAERFPNGRLTLERLRAEQKLRAAREQDGF